MVSTNFSFAAAVRCSLIFGTFLHKVDSFPLIPAKHGAVSFLESKLGLSTTDNSIEETIRWSDGIAESCFWDDNDKLPPPPAPKSDDAFFLKFRQRVPIPVQRWLRDSGVLRAIINGAVWAAFPQLIAEQPQVLGDFVWLMIGSEMNKSPLFSLLPGLSQSLQEQLETSIEPQFTVENIKYANDDRRQFMSLIRNQEAPKTPSSKENRTIVFVHGGAWGSGFPSMYSLVATPFLNEGYGTVAMVGYRTYPSATVDGQVGDLVLAFEKIVASSPPDTKLTIIGHSSGSHILSVGFLRQKFASISLVNQMDQFVGLCGVNDIYAHYKFEQSRGVERISPMAPTCGCSYKNFRANSPTRIASKLGDPLSTVSRFPPRSVFLHGTEDNVVPYTSSKWLSEECGVPWKLLNNVGHAEMVTDIMFGGITRQVVLDFIESD